MSKEMEEFDNKKKERMELSDLAARNIKRGRDHGLRFSIIFLPFIGVFSFSCK